MSEAIDNVLPLPNQLAYPTVETDGKGRPRFPSIPDEDDHAALCRWLTVALALNVEMPVVAVEWTGRRGPDGHILIHRAGDALAIRIEPARNLNAPIRLKDSMTGWRAKGDGRLGKITGDNCEEIKYVVELLADTSLVTTERDEALHILALYLQRAEPADDTRDLTTYGDSQERYAAAIAMRRTGEFEPYRYLVDAGSGERIDPDSGELLDEGQERELVIPVGDLQSVARESAGTSLARGWLDARMSELGWRRIVIDGHRDSGRIGRRGSHARIYAYRGVLPDDDGSVTT